MSKDLPDKTKSRSFKRIITHDHRAGRTARNRAKRGRRKARGADGSSIDSGSDQ